MTEGQVLLARYLGSLKMERLEALIIMAMLSTEEATMEMLKYIAKNHPLDQAKLYTIACEISKRMNSEPKD